MAIELEKGQKRTAPPQLPWAQLGIGEFGAHCIFSSSLGITVVACVLLAPTKWLSSGRVGLGGFQSDFQVPWIPIKVMALETTHRGKPRPLYTCSLESASYLTGGSKAGELRKHWSPVPCLVSSPPPIPTFTADVKAPTHPQQRALAVSTCFACALTQLLLLPSLLSHHCCLSVSPGIQHISSLPSVLGQTGLLPPSGNADFVKASVEAAGCGCGCGCRVKGGST